MIAGVIISLTLLALTTVFCAYEVILLYTV